MEMFDVYPVYPIHIVKGRGATVTDDQGSDYLDFYGGHAVISIGHSHPHFVSRMTQQLGDLAFYSNSIENSLQSQLAHLLGITSGLEDYRLFLVNSGAEAIENALKLASFHTGRTKVISFRRGFHGRTSAAVNITDNDKIIAPINHGFENVLLDLEDFDGVAEQLKTKDVCAVVIEGIQGIGGMYEASPEFLRHLQNQCRQYGSVLILDEIQSGYGRTGRFFAFQQVDGLQPDLVTMAKGMGNGYPIGGVLISPMFEASNGLLGTTFGGNHLACAAGIAVLEVIRSEDLLRNAELVGRMLHQQLSSIPHVREVRGKGL
ncbi:MAG: aspartate aminotransferase family protein, partial [Saprospiraceae bacterium]|nr:aspartate aminotransferase family protein [Saprospiraceae bacterium]